MHREIFRPFNRIGADTAAIVFLLALEFGRAVVPFSFDGILMATAIVAVIAMPYFFAWTETDLGFGEWLLLRSGFAVAGLICGSVMSAIAGSIIQESTSYLPMLVLTVVVALSFVLNASGFLRLQLAK